MDLKELGTLHGNQATHWYFASKSRALLTALGPHAPRRVVDVGAGSGFFARVILARTPAQIVVCVDPGYATESIETHDGKTLEFRRSSPVGDADLVIMMDVLEHVDDDVALVRAFAADARPGTRFVVSVPAFSWLWSGHDVFLEHRRRYTLKQAQRVLVDAGLTPTGGFYFFATVFPGALAQRMRHRRPESDALRSHLRAHHRLTNFALTAICRAENVVARYNRAFGLTAFAVAEKR
jgi:2-polyprenyl-3-methyl-5-hydroxy-6-metoxy-1,4-benzoquinol methylase